MTEINNTWTPTCNRFVAFLDIMGFRDTVFRNEHSFVASMMLQLTSVLAPIKLDADIRLKTPKEGPFGNTVVRPVFFSDSILLVSSNDTSQAMLHLLFCINWITNSAMVAHVPIKGAIAYGMQTADFDLSVHFGRPLIDAYELQNELQMYGIILHHTAEKRLIDAGMMPEFPYYLKQYAMPLKGEAVTHYAVKFHKVGTNPDLDLPKVVASFYSSVSGHPRTYVDNTLKFLKDVPPE